MSFEHIVFIPGVLLVGTILGYILGARAVRAEVAQAKRKAKE
jgi:hypothetical protein